MQIVERGADRLVVLGGAMLHEDDHQQVTARVKRTGKKFAEATADYVRDLREALERRGGGAFLIENQDNLLTEARVARARRGC